MTITVRDAIKVGKLSQGIVIAGDNGLDNVISYIDVLEVPDIAQWLTEGVLLFTTGYAIQENIEEQINLINLLHCKKAAGLVIKANRFLKEIPKEMIKLANKLNVPIISIPGDIPYVEAIYPIIREILSHQVRVHLMKNHIEEIIDKSELLPERVTLDEINKVKSGMKLSAPYVISLIPFESDSQLNRYVNISEIEKSKKMISFKSDDIFVCITTIDSKKWRDKIFHTIFKDSFLDDRSLFCLTSYVINSFQRLKSEYLMLKKSLNYLGSIPSIREKMIYFDDVVHYILMKKIVDDEDSISLVTKLLEPIESLEEKEKKIMFNTLYSYVSNGGNKTKAASKSYVHRNTFYYRMDKLSKILNSNLESQEEIYKYKLILDLYLINKSNNS
ncbi:MAG: PucR family transcriptional regulator [Tissierellaceae bacterium]